MATEALVSPDEVKIRVKIGSDETNAENDEDIAAMSVEATDIVLDYCTKQEVSWTPTTVPPRIKTAILLVIQNIYDGEEEPLSTAVKNILRRDRRPVVV